MCFVVVCSHLCYLFKCFLHNFGSSRASRREFGRPINSKSTFHREITTCGFQETTWRWLRMRTKGIARSLQIPSCDFLLKTCFWSVLVAKFKSSFLKINRMIKSAASTPPLTNMEGKTGTAAVAPHSRGPCGCAHLQVGHQGGCASSRLAQVVDAQASLTESGTSL